MKDASSKTNTVIPSSIKEELFSLSKAEEILIRLNKIKSNCCCWEEHKEYYLNDFIPELQKSICKSTKEEAENIKFLKENLPLNLYNQYLNAFFQNLETLINEYNQIKLEKQEKFKKFLDGIEQVLNKLKLISDDDVCEIKAKYNNLWGFLNTEQINEYIDNCVERLRKQRHPIFLDIIKQEVDNCKKTVKSEIAKIKTKYFELAKKYGYQFNNIEDFINNYTSQIKEKEYQKFLSRLTQNFNNGYISKQNTEEVLISLKTEIETNEYNLSDIRDYLKTYTHKENKNFISQEITLHQGAFSFEKKGKLVKLNDEQIRAAITDEKSNLVVAGAGCGKTTMLLGKIKYLLEKGIKPEEILLLSYTKKTIEDINKDLKQINISSISARTFHSLGTEITHKDADPNILDTIITESFDSTRASVFEKIKKAILSFFAFNLGQDSEIKAYNEDYYINNPNTRKKTISEFERLKHLTLKGQIEAFKKKKTTIEGTKVKSLAEVEIANYLFLHNIPYEYEKDYTMPYYRLDGKKDNSKKYKPDFCIQTPKGEIWLEHFGVTKDKNGNYHAHWCETEEKYINQIYDKRNTHTINKTILIETNETDHQEGTLIKKLETYLRNFGVDITTKLSDEKLKEYIDILLKKELLKSLKDFIKQYISLFKSKYTFKNTEELNKILNKLEQDLLKEYPFGYYYQKTKRFFKILLPIFTEYENELKLKEKIDYNDMITQAIDILQNDAYKGKYRNIKYIIVDEYQDITQKRYEFIKTLQKISNAHLFCVGDDWQSIYGFNGSDVSLFTDFNNLYPYSGPFLKLNTVYRNSQELLDISSKFIMKNKKEQIEKHLISNKRYQYPVVHIDYTDYLDYKNKISDKIEKLTYILELIHNKDKSATICLLGRYNPNINKLFENTNEFYNQELVNGDKKEYRIKYKKYPEMDIKYSTIHSAKGLEYDYTILIDLEETEDAPSFPSNVETNYLLKPFLHKESVFLHAEERRMFYVALTRCQKRCFILSSVDSPSTFFQEIEKDSHLINGTGETCPYCKSRMIKRYNPTQKKYFLGCSMYKLTGCDARMNLPENRQNSETINDSYNQEMI